jgi:hypothetical protein
VDFFAAPESATADGDASSSTAIGVPFYIGDIGVIGGNVKEKQLEGHTKKWGVNQSVLKNARRSDTLIVGDCY